MATSSWWACDALRSRVSMSAIGSVIVIVDQFSLAVVSATGPAASVGIRSCVGTGSPAGLGDPGQLAAVCHLPKADAAEPELAVDRLWPAAPLAAGVGAHRELGLAGGLHLEGCLGHVTSP